jgi:hypothetical protein
MKGIWQIRETLIRKINGLNLGELDELDDMTTAELESLYHELSTAQDNGRLNVETNEGIDNLKLIVDKYL